jgi:hypothetical protein
MWTEFVDELVNLGNSVQHGNLDVFKRFKEALPSMAYPQSHVDRGNVAQFVYVKRMVLQGTEKKSLSFLRGSFSVRSSVTCVS